MRIFSSRVQGPAKFRLYIRSPKKLVRVAFAGAVFSLGLAPASSESLPDVQIRKLQEALIWTTDYEGLVDGKLGSGTVEAINKFQARIGNPATGQLTPAEFTKLVKQGTAYRASTGFAQFTDNSAGVAIGLPLALVSGPTPTKWGKHWYSKQAGLSIDTLRFNSDTSLKELYTKLMGINNRKVAYHRLVEDDWFVIAAFEGEAAVYIRANLVTTPGQASEIRGFSIWMSKNRPTSYQSIPPAMLSSFRSDTDKKNDASTNTPMGGELILADPKSHNVIPNPPPRTIQATGTASSAGSCLNGLGECPLLTFK